MKYYLKAKKIFAENKILKDQSLIVENKKIKGFIKNKKLGSEAEVIDYGDKIIIPALIDLHIHGAVGKDVMDSDYGSLNEISKHLAENGVGSFLATTLTAPFLKIKKALRNINKTMKKGVEGAEILGAYLEGPYLTAEHNGAHPIKHMRDISLKEIKKLIEASGNQIKIFALAPEKRKAKELINFLNTRDITPAIAHTNADYETTLEAIENGVNLATHTYNGMKGFHHRKPGTLGAVLNSEKLYSELIVDNIHLHPAATELLFKLKKIEKIILISDCMRAGGLKDGEYKLGELTVEVNNSIARTESGSLAGSTLKIKDAVKNIKEITELNFYSALKTATIVPAKLLGLEKEIGSIKKGKKANLAVVDSAMNVFSTIINGKIVYRKQTN